MVSAREHAVRPLTIGFPVKLVLEDNREVLVMLVASVDELAKLITCGDQRSSCEINALRHCRA